MEQAERSFIPPEHIKPSEEVVKSTESEIAKIVQTLDKEKKRLRRFEKMLSMVKDDEQKAKRQKRVDVFFCFQADLNSKIEDLEASLELVVPEIDEKVQEDAYAENKIRELTVGFSKV